MQSKLMMSETMLQVFGERRSMTYIVKICSITYVIDHKSNVADVSNSCHSNVTDINNSCLYMVVHTHI